MTTFLTSMKVGQRSLGFVLGLARVKHVLQAPVAAVFTLRAVRRRRPIGQSGSLQPTTCMQSEASEARMSGSTALVNLCGMPA